MLLFLLHPHSSFSPDLLVTHTDLARYCVSMPVMAVAQKHQADLSHRQVLAQVSQAPRLQDLSAHRTP